MNGVLCLGKGRLSGACMVNGESVIVIKRGGTLYKKRLLPGREILDDGIIGYNGDCFVFPGGKLIIDSEVRYEADNS